MSSIITGILSSTIGLLWNKARDKTVDKLKDGDVTDAKIREYVMRDLNDISTKLEGLSRKDVLSSYRFLKEGVDFLNVSLDKSNDAMPKLDVATEVQDDHGAMSSGVECGILSEALKLSHAMSRVKINSDKELESAKERFKYSRIKATEAFSNEALTIQDRIFAAKLRVVSEILECLESSESAITGCLSFLRDLHSLPAIREMFSVYLNGGIKSMLNKAERTENVTSVMTINFVLYEFVSKFGTKYCSVYAWPTIDIVCRIFRPILQSRDVSLRPPNVMKLNELIESNKSAVNGNGEIIVQIMIFSDDADAIKVISKTGESKVVKLPDLGDGKVMNNIEALAVDSNNNAYVLCYYDSRTENGDVRIYELYVLDENYKLKHRYILDFLGETQLGWNPVKIAVNQNNDIIVIKRNDPHVYVCDNSGQLKHKFERDSQSHLSLAISDKNEILLSADNDRAIFVYTLEGDLKLSVNVPEGYRICGIGFHHVVCKIIVLARCLEMRAISLLYYSETGDHLESSTFVNTFKEAPSIISHPMGFAAVVKRRNITFL